MSETANQLGRIAAVFDIDGTLLPPPSLELRLVARLALQRELRLSAIVHWLPTFVPRILWMPRGNRKGSARPLTLDENKSYLAGVRIGAVEEWIERRLAELEFFSEALVTVEWHRQRGHAIVLVSGTLAPLARAVGSISVRGEEIYVCATEIERDGGVWTGRVDGEAICGPAKERALVRLADEHHFDLKRSYAYADSMKDRWMLGAVGHPIAVNPSPLLAQHARRYGWRLVSWNKRAHAPGSAKYAPFVGTVNEQQDFAEKLSWK
jgi:HAD superfamily hydrolase (TIGR01490 family)